MTDALETDPDGSPLRPETWTRHTLALRRMAHALLGDVHASEDVVQTAALRALARPPRVLSRAWLRRVVQNRVRDARRVQRAEVELGDAELARAPSAEEVAERLELGRVVLDAVNALDEPYRSAVYLRYFEGLSVERVALAQGVPRRTAQTRLYRALGLLRQRLSNHFGEDDGERGWRAVLGAVALDRSARRPPEPLVNGSTASSLVLHATSTVLMIKKLALAAACLLAVFGAWSWIDGEKASVEPVTHSRSTADAREGVSPTAALESASAERQAARAGAPAGAPPAAPVATGTGSLRVLVLSPTGDPAPDACVLLRGPRRDLPDTPLARAFTGSDGRVSFDALPVGPVRVSCVRATARTREVDVVAGESHEMTLQLEAGAHVRGVVQDDGGRPVPEAEVWLTTGSADWQGGHVVARCDRAGRFELRDLPERQSLAALAEGYAPSALLDLELIDLTPPVEITLTLSARGGALEGVVRDPTGAPLAGALVAVGTSPRYLTMGATGNTVEYWTPRAVSTGEDGTFRVHGLAPGEHEVRVRAEPFPVWSGSAEVRALATTNVDVRLEVGTTVSGTVRDHEGAPVAHATLRAFDEPLEEESVAIGLLPRAGAFGYPCVRADEQGRYELAALPSGELQLVVHGPTTHRDARNDRPVPHASERLELRDGEHSTWDPVLGEGRVIHGRLTRADGHPLEQVLIRMRPEELAPSEGSTPTYFQWTDGDGRFRFLNLTERSYALVADVRFPRDGAPVEASGIWPDGPEVALVAELPARERAVGQVVGRVRDAAGHFGECRRAVILESEAHSWRVGPEWEGDGFRFEEVEAGRHRVVVMCGDSPVVHGAWIEVRPGETTDVGELVTVAAARITIRLTRGPGTEDSVPTAVVRPADSWQATRQELKGGDEHAIEGLSPGTYIVHLYGAGMANVQREVELGADADLSLELPLEAAVMVPIEVDWPADAVFEELELSVTDASGAQRWSQTLINGSSLQRPYQRGLNLPVGRYSLGGESDAGHAGRVDFEVLDLSSEPARARAELR